LQIGVVFALNCSCAPQSPQLPHIFSTAKKTKALRQKKKNQLKKPAISALVDVPSNSKLPAPYTLTYYQSELNLLNTANNIHA
jgi:hypothetical protein